LILVPARTLASVFTSPSAFAQMLQAGEPGLVPLGDRRAAEADGDGVAVGPIGDLARRNHRAGVFLARDLHRNVEIDLLPPSHRRALNRQRRGDRLRGRRVEKLGVESERTEVEANTHTVLLARHGRLGSASRAEPRANTAR
jgi:hypothetical protein